MMMKTQMKAIITSSGFCNHHNLHHNHHHHHRNHHQNDDDNAEECDSQQWVLCQHSRFCAEDITGLGCNRYDYNDDDDYDDDDYYYDDYGDDDFAGDGDDDD